MQEINAGAASNAGWQADGPGAVMRSGASAKQARRFDKSTTRADRKPQLWPVFLAWCGTVLSDRTALAEGAI